MPTIEGPRLRRALVTLATAAVFWGVAPLEPLAAEPHGNERTAPLEVRVDPADVDLSRGEITVRASRPAARVTLEVIGISGAVLAKVSENFDAAPAGSPLTVRFPVPDAAAAGADASGSSSSPARDTIARIELFVYDTKDYYKGIALTPWSVEIPHEDVVFETDSAVIRPSEEAKLKASLERIRRELPRARHLGTITLYVIAHTDTVGGADYNLELSTRRARAISQWFRARGLSIPIAYDGVGEKALKVKTADEVDEPRNRRADYMLGIESPRFKDSGVTPRWKRL